MKEFRFLATMKTSKLIGSLINSSIENYAWVMSHVMNSSWAVKLSVCLIFKSGLLISLKVSS
jgi:hypothetical protein